MINRPLPVKICAKGEWIHTQGKRSDFLYIIREGIVLLTRLSIDGGETILAVLGPGEHFGDVNLLLNESAGYNSIALVKTELRMISRSAFQELLKKPEACGFLMNRLAGRCSDSWTQMEALACNEATEKIRIALSWLSTRIGEATSEGIHINISQALLAKMIGTSRENLNRKLSSLREEGILDTAASRGRKWNLLVRNPEFLSMEDCGIA